LGLLGPLLSDPLLVRDEGKGVVVAEYIQTNFHMDPETHRKIKICAKLKKIKMGDFLKILINEYFDENKDEMKKEILKGYGFNGD
jgi:hypothetical protein